MACLDVWLEEIGLDKEVPGLAFDANTVSSKNISTTPRSSFSNSSI